MNTLILATALSALQLGPLFGRILGDETPPRPFTGSAVLPGEIVAQRKQLNGSWVFNYQQREATLESGYQGALITSLQITFREEGTYELLYNAIWDFALGTDSPLPTLGASPASRDGVTVTETGKYALSGEILLLEPAETRHTEIRDNEIVRARQKISNENRALLLRVDGKRLHIAGRCAKYQVEPICRETQDVWVQLISQVGRRWLGRG